MTEKRQKYGGMQEEEPVRMKGHRKTHTWCGEKRQRESEQSIQMCNHLMNNRNNKMRHTGTKYI